MSALQSAMSMNLLRLRCVPGRDGIEQSLRHPNELRISDGMDGASPRRTSDDIELANSVTLAILADDRNFGLLIRDCSQTSVDDDVEAVADILRAPQDLPGVDLHPIQRGIDVFNCGQLSVKTRHVKPENRPSGESSEMRRLARVSRTIGRASRNRSRDFDGRNPTYASVLAVMSTYDARSHRLER
jgi:hypothetical protein